MASPFYWRHARDSLLTPVALELFQLLARHEGEPFDEVKDRIDEEYEQIRGKPSQRHGGKTQTAVNVYREAGWVSLQPDGQEKPIIHITDAGRQALQLLHFLPDFLKGAPYFVVELLSRYQLNNPARPAETRDEEYDRELRESNVFPYWTLFKVMRECDNTITVNELRRFVFQLKRSEDIPNAITQIKNFRKDKETGTTEEELNNRYPAPLEGAVAEPKYLMGRLGIQVGRTPRVVHKEGQDRWRLEPAYLPFIDRVLANEPIFKEHLDESSWMAEYGRPVDITVDGIVMEEEGSDEPWKIEDPIPDDDPIWRKVEALVQAGGRTLLLSGPPGTSKTWYAARIANKLVSPNGGSVRHIQFHPSYSYDDFVEGYIPRGDFVHGGRLFEIVPKMFLKMCERATQNPNSYFVIVIDEFTRGDASRIFGEVLTYIEPSYRNNPFILAYSQRPIRIPPNLFIIATMNPFDRSVTELDDALTRRFHRIALDPSPAILAKLLKEAGAAEELKGRVIEWFLSTNKLTVHGLGHSYFLAIKTEGDLIRLWNHMLRFVLERMFQFERDKFEEVKTGFKGLVSNPAEIT